MSFAATAIVGSALVGAYASSQAADKAADAQVAGTDAATAEQRRQYDQTRQDYAPWREAGQNALTRMQDPNAFETSPGYGFRVSEGNRNVENRFSARGGGGNAMRALTEFNQNLASNEYGAWWNRQAGLAGVGQQATAGTAYAGSRAADNISNNYLNAGNARASGIQQKYGGINDAVQSGISNSYYKWGGPNAAIGRANNELINTPGIF